MIEDSNELPRLERENRPRTANLQNPAVVNVTGFGRVSSVTPITSALVAIEKTVPSPPPTRFNTGKSASLKKSVPELMSPVLRSLPVADLSSSCFSCGWPRRFLPLSPPPPPR